MQNEPLQFLKGNLIIEVQSAEIIVDSDTFTMMDLWV